MVQGGSDEAVGTVLLIGASRGLGLAMAGEFARRGWRVVATVRGPGRTALHALQEETSGRIAVETVDIGRPEEIAALRGRLSGRVFDVLFVNAGTANAGDEGAGGIATEEFARVLVTNALGPMRVIAAMEGLVAPGGLIGVMSSGQGSIADNGNGRHEVYRCSKSALNQLMRSYAARRAEAGRPLLLLAPGWIRTALGGEAAPYGVEESTPKLVDVVLAKRGRPGLEYLDREGRTVRW